MKHKMITSMPAPEKHEEERDPVPSVTEILGTFESDDCEYDCGKPCTEHGCHGHSCGIPSNIIFAGQTFVVYGYDAGDFPNEDAPRVQEVVGKVATASRLFKPALDLIHQMVTDQETLAPGIRNQALIESGMKILKEAEYPGYEH